MIVVTTSASSCFGSPRSRTSCGGSLYCGCLAATFFSCPDAFFAALSCNPCATSLLLDEPFGNQQTSVPADQVPLTGPSNHTAPAFSHEHSVACNQVKPIVKPTVHAWDRKPHFGLRHLQQRLQFG